MGKILSSIAAAFSGPGVHKFVEKITSRAVVAPLVYAISIMTIFALIYGFIGYNKHFATSDENRNKNWPNAITASVMLQSNAMGQVEPITNLGRILFTIQTFLGWAYFLAIISIIT
jgi:hypothetical protein